MNHSGRQKNKPAQARLLRIHDRLNAAFTALHSRRLNCTTLGEELGVSSKTIQRDLTYMQDTLGLPIEYDIQEKSYAYTKEVPCFPLGPDLTVDERRALLLASRALAEFSGVAFAAELEEAYEKITGGLFAESPESIDGYLSVRSLGAGVIRDKKVFLLVRRALLEHLELRVNYQGRGKAQPAERIIQPLHLACIENRWLLLARDPNQDRVKTFVLARMADPKLTNTHFNRPVDFKPDLHFEHSFGSWIDRGKAGPPVVLSIKAAGAHHVLERKWHKSQQVTILPGGDIKVTFVLSNLNDVKRWILSFGQDCRVEQPLELARDISAEAASIRAQYD